MTTWLTRLTTACLLALTAGCSAAPPSSFVIPTLSPRREALAYFSAGAPVVAVVSTDPQDPEVRRLAGSGLLAPLQRAVEAQGVHFAQLRPLLGHDLVVGQPAVGAPPLAVLLTGDAGGLRSLAKALVLAHRATPAGVYRGAELYAARRYAFAVRGAVLLAGASTPQLMQALDTRVGDDGFEAAQLNRVLPRGGRPGALAHAFVDLRPLVARVRPAARTVPLARALSAAGVTVSASATGLDAVVLADTSDAGLTDADLLASHAPSARVPVPRAASALAVTDLGRFLQAAERAARIALPVGILRIDALRERLRVAGVKLSAELLRGPASLTALRDAKLLRLEPAHPRALARALSRAARRLRAPHWAIRSEDGLYAVRDRGQVVLRLGLVDGVLVAGRVRAATLTRFAAVPVSPVRGPVALRLSPLAVWFPRPVVATLRGTPDALRVDAHAGF